MNSNGLLSFGQCHTFPPTSTNFYPPGVSDGIPTIALFYTDTLQGNVSVKEVNDTQTVNAVLSLINMSFEQSNEFTPSSIYNVSWEDVRSTEHPDMVSSHSNVLD